MSVQKRLYVGNLWSTATEKAVKQCFAIFGEVQTVAINHKNGKTFAFVDVLTSPKIFPKTLRKLNSEGWNGCNIKVEEAKESFLTRLKKEREENVKKPPKVEEKVPEKKKLNNFHKVVTKELDNLSMSGNSSEEDVKDGLPRFKGIAGILDTMPHESDNKDKLVKKKKPKHNIIPSQNNACSLENDILSRFESFNDVWKDTEEGPPVKKKPPKLSNGVVECKKAPKNLTKIEKSKKDDERRRKSLNDAMKLKSQQKNMIKSALSQVDSVVKPNKKILFGDEVNASETDILDDVKKVSGGKRKLQLFSEDGNNDTNEVQIEIKSQFEGKRGRKLLELQSTFKNDERFKIDKRFADDDYGKVEDKEEDGLAAERKDQLRILSDVLGHPIAPTRAKDRSGVEMLRFDPARAEHAQYMVAEEEAEEGGSNEVGGGKAVPPTPPAPSTSKEKFYKVSGNLSMSGGAEGFSLLTAFGAVDESKAKAVEAQEAERRARGEAEEAPAAPPGRQGGGGQHSRPASAVGLCIEKFFFQPNDPRLQEGLAFINQKNSAAAKEAAASYDERRKELREITRMATKKHLKRKNPFRKKIGGMKGGPRRHQGAKKPRRS